MSANKNNLALSISIIGYAMISMAFFAISHSEWVRSDNNSHQMNESVLFPGLANDTAPEDLFNHFIQ